MSSIEDQVLEKHGYSSQNTDTYAGGVHTFNSPVTSQKAETNYTPLIVIGVFGFLILISCLLVAILFKLKKK